MPLMALHELERQAERRCREAAAAAAAQAAAEHGIALARCRRRPGSQPSLASVPENIIAEEEEGQPAAAAQEVGAAAEGQAGGGAEAGPLLREANFLQWCLRPYFYSSLAWSAVALLLPALPLAVEGAADAPAGTGPMN